jgi:hypothetical protein
MTEEFNEKIQAIASALYEEAGSHAGSDGWTECVLNILYDEGRSFSGFVDLVMVDGPKRSLNLSNDTLDLTLLKLASHRSDFGTRWHGLKLTISSAGECKMDLIYETESEVSEKEKEILGEE